MCRAEDVVGAGVDAEFVELFDVLPRTARGVVGKKRPADVELLDLREKGLGEFEQGRAEVKCAVEIEGEVLYLCEALLYKRSAVA